MSSTVPIARLVALVWLLAVAALGAAQTDPGAYPSDVRAKPDRDSIAALETADPLPAPTFVAAYPGDGGLTLVWEAPLGASGVIDYDLRYIPSGDDEAVDANWTERPDILSSETAGRLVAVVRGFPNGETYGLALRASQGAEDSAWSSTLMATTAEPGESVSAALELPLDVPIAGVMTSSADEDWFHFTLAEQATVLFFSTGGVSRRGRIQDSTGRVLREDLGGGKYFLPRSSNFLLGRNLSAGTYTLEVERFLSNVEHPMFPPPDETGEYLVHAELLPDSPGFSSARDVAVGGGALGFTEGPQGSRDTDYFRLTLTERTDLLVRLDGRAWIWSPGPSGRILDRDGNLVASNDYSDRYYEPYEFVIRARLDAGVYYVEVDAEWSYGVYQLVVDEVDEPGSTLDTAQPIHVEKSDWDVSLLGGRIDSASDSDYFSFEVPWPDSIGARLVGDDLEISGTLLDSEGAKVDTKFFADRFSSTRAGFTFVDFLEKGTWYLKVDGKGATFWRSSSPDSIFPPDAPIRRRR